MTTSTRSQSRNGLTTFAAFGAGTIGVWNLVSGIAAVSKDDATKALNEVLFGINIDVWGWFWIVAGAVQIVTAVLIYQRHTVGKALGMIWATIVASLAVFLIFSAPIWSLTVMAVNMFVIYTLAIDEDFGEY